MLKFFKRMERTRNFVLLIFSIVMVASLILFYAPTQDLGTNLTQNEETIAKVSGEIITVAEVARQQETMSQFGRSMPAKLMLDGMIRERVIRVESARLGLTATDAEVAARIRDQFKSTDAAPFDQTKYESNVSQQFGSVKAYEQIVRDEISGQKLEAFLTSGATVSETEVLDDYKRKNTKFDITYVPITVTDLAQTLKPTDQELQAYFENNKKSYYISSPQKKLRYVFVNTAKIGEKLNISDADLQAEFDKLSEDKRIAGVQGQQIVLRFAKPEFEQSQLEKGNQLVAQARKDGGKISEEAFALIAKGQSEDAATASTGGKIAGLIRENPANPTDPYQTLLKMQPGEVSEPIKHENRFFILRRGEAVPKTIESAKKELDVSLRNRRAYTAAAELANKITERLKAEKDVAKIAAEFAAQANMSAGDMIKETGYVKPGDDVKDVGVSDQFEQGIAGLENANDVGDKIPVPNGFAIPLLVEKKEPRDAELSEVREKVLEAVKAEQARAKVSEIANHIASAAGTASGLSAAATGKGLKAQDSKSFVVGSPLGQGPTATTSEALEDAIYNLNVGEVTKTPISIGDNWFVVGVNKREEASLEEFAKQRDSLTQSMLQTKRQAIFSDFLASRQREMEAKGEIVIYKDALAQMEAIPTTAPQQSQQEMLQQQIQQQIMQQQQEQPAPLPAEK